MSKILKGLNESRNYGRDSWDSNMPGYQGDYGGAENFNRRQRDWDENDAIDARLRQQHAQRQEYEKSGKFWLKLKDTQRHLPAGPFIGKQAATQAAHELFKQQPELKGNLLLTAYGPDENVEESKEADYGPDYQDMVKRVGQLAKEGPRKTVWDPVKRVYKTVPVNPPKKEEGVTEEQVDENLRKWFKEKWVRFGPDGKIRGACARGDDSEGKPKCLPQSKAHSLGKKGRASAAARKRREDPNPERSGKAINVATKKKTNEAESDINKDTFNKVYQLMIQKKPEFMKMANTNDVHKAILKAMSFGPQISVNDLASYAYGMLKTNDINENKSEKRCMQCGMTNCSCPAGTCKCKPIKGWIPNKGFQKAKEGVSETEGRFAGDVPINLGGDIVKRLEVGDIVSYFGQKAKILAMSKTGNTSRIHIPSSMGGVTKDVLTKDLKRTSLSEEELDEACWKGYHKEGMKTMFGKKYPNCVKNKKKRTNEEQGVVEGSEQNLSVQQLATISDEALDKAYGYGRSNPGNTFGWQANLMSAAYAKKMIDAGVTDIEKISDAIHKGWNVTAQKFVQNPDQFDDTEKLRQAGKLEAKLAQRAKLMKINYGQLDNEEQEKDRVVARALLQAIKGQQGMTEEHHSESCPHCGGEMVSEELMNEKKDACYYKVKSRYKVWPSAYASGALVKCRKKGAKNWGNKSESVEEGDKLQGTPVVSLKDFGDKDNTKNKYGQTVPKKLKKDDPRVKFHKDQKQGVAEGYEGDDRGDYHSTARAANQASRTAKSRQDHAKAADLHNRAATYGLSAGQDQSVIHDHQMAAREHNRASKGLKEQDVAETKVSKYKDLGATKSTTHFIKNVTTGKIVSPHRSRQDAEDALVASMRDSNDEFKIVRARKEGVAEGLNEAVDSNYLYHSTETADTAKKILSSGVFKAGNSNQDATNAQVGNLPTVSFGRNIAYQLSGENVNRDYEVVFVVDRSKLEQRYKTFGTSQSRENRGLAFPKPGNLKAGEIARSYDVDKSGNLDKRDADEIHARGTIQSFGKPAPRDMVGQFVGRAKQQFYAPKSGGEFEEVVPTKTGMIPWKGMLVGFYLVPGKAASRDPELLNHPLRLDMPRPNQFVKAKQQQGVAEEQLDEKWSQKYKDSINCSNPKGFSQKAHCAGKKKNESFVKESAIMKGLK